MNDAMRLGLGPGEGPRLLEVGLPDVWSDDGTRLGLGHGDGALLVGARDAVWLPVPGLVDLRGDPLAGWWALGEDLDGCTAWRLDPDRLQAVPVARLGSPSEQLSLVPGGVVQRRAGRSRVIDLRRGGRALPLPLGAARGRVAASPGVEGLVWADGPSLYRGMPGTVRSAGTAPGPLTRLWAGPGGAFVGLISGERGIGAAPGRVPLGLPLGPTARPAFDPTGRTVLLQDEDAVLQVDLVTGETLETWEDLELVGSPRALLDLYESAVVGLDGTPLLTGLVPAAAAVLDDRVVGPGGAAWDLQTGTRLWESPDARAEHLVVVEDRLVAILDGEAVVLRADGSRAGRFGLPSPFDDPDALDEVLAAPGGLLLVGEDGALWVDLRGRLLGGAPPRVPPEPDPPPEGWHWNNAGLLLRLA